MAKVRVTAAFGEGFRLIGREPLSVLAWGGVLFVLAGLPAILMLSRLAPAFSQLISNPEPNAMLAAETQMFGMMLLANLGGILAYVLLIGGVLRAVLTPDDRGWKFYLRLGAPEGWMALSALVLFVGAYIAMTVAMVVLLLVVMLPLGLAAGTGGAGGDPQFATIALAMTLMFAIIFALSLASAYFVCRLGIGVIASFDRRKFALFDAWSMTKGEGWRLFGMAILQIFAVIAIELVVFVMLFAVGAMNFPNMAGDPNSVLAFSAQIMAFYASPFAVVLMAVGSLIGGALIAIFVAPWARAYLMLREDYDKPSVFA